MHESKRYPRTSWRFEQKWNHFTKIDIKGIDDRVKFNKLFSNFKKIKYI